MFAIKCMVFSKSADPCCSEKKDMMMSAALENQSERHPPKQMRMRGDIGNASENDNDNSDVSLEDGEIVVPVTSTPMLDEQQQQALAAMTERLLVSPPKKSDIFAKFGECVQNVRTCVVLALFFYLVLCALVNGLSYDQFKSTVAELAKSYEKTGLRNTLLRLVVYGNETVPAQNSTVALGTTLPLGTAVAAATALGIQEVLETDYQYNGAPDEY